MCVERSHAHANSIVLQLLNCHPVAADTDKSTTKKELVKVSCLLAELMSPWANAALSVDCTVPRAYSAFISWVLNFVNFAILEPFAKLFNENYFRLVPRHIARVGMVPV